MTKKPLILSPDIWGDESKLRRVFSWLTRCGAGRKFGSLPIGWYQQHQYACIDALILAAGEAPLRSRGGNIQARRAGKWVTLFAPVELFRKADNAVRSKN